MVKNLNKITLYEALSLINEKPELLKDPKSFQYHQGSALELVFQCAFLPEYRFDLPEGVPSFEYCTQAIGMCPDDLLVAIRRNRFDYFIKDRIKINDQTRQRIFVKLLEGVHRSEAMVLLAIKDQDLTRMFPNITYDVLADAGYLPKKESESDTKSLVPENTESVDMGTPPKRKRGRPRKKPLEEGMEKPEQ